MTEHGWHPDQIGRLTVVQLMCLGNAEPPQDPGRPKISTFEQHQQYAALLKQSRESWDFDLYGAIRALSEGIE